MAYSVDASTYYSSPSGSGATCSSSSPCSYATGVGKLVSGDTLMLGAGIYNMNINGGSIPNGTVTARTKIIGAGVNSTIIRPSSPTYHIFSFNSPRSYLEISDMEIDGSNLGAQSGLNTLNIDAPLTSVKFARMKIHDSANANIFGGTNSADLEFIDIESYGSGSGGRCNPPTGGYCHGFYMGPFLDGSTIFFDRIRSHNNYGLGFQTYVYTSANFTASVINSMFYDNDSFGFYWARDNSSSNFSGTIKLYNNVFYLNNWDGASISTGGNIFMRNNISLANNGNQLNGGVQDHNIISGAPADIWVNPAGGDFHLKSGSSAINAGATLSEVLTDYDGVSRPQGSAYDIGAYEYASGGSPQNLLGDINGDRIVNSLDWSLMSAKWLTSDVSADLNKDGAVNSLDWSVMSSNWLKTI